ncbi:MAG: PAS domain S-box protein [Pyrinomonadaceae bacterium]|nr:PAS domain S-box protein [Pyrinomonadaceae bacterium]
MTPHSPTILVVNDTVEVLELLTLLLSHEGYRVVSATDGPSALLLAQQSEPDIIISDVVMPDMDGLEFCRRLKEDARTRDVPVLLVSAVRTGEEDSLTGLVAGADDYLGIPFRRQELLVKVARLAERHRVERHYREIVEQAADIIYTCDMEGRITSINEAGARFFGHTASELIGVRLCDFLGEEAERALPDNLNPETSEPVRAVYRAKDAEGVAHYLESVATTVRDATGQPTGVRSVVRDITERKLAEDALRESEERYREMFEKNQAIKLLIDPETGEIVEANPAACEFYGYSLEEFKQKKITEINMLPEAEVRAELESVVHEERSFFVFPHRLASGEVREMEVHAGPIQSKGRRLIYSILHDITDRRRAEAALRDSEEKFRAQYKGLPLPTYSWRRVEDDFLLVDFNDAASEITQGRINRFLGRRASEMYSDRPDITEDFLRCFEERTVIRREMDYKFRATGESKYLDTTYVFVPPDMVMVHTDDITERKRAEEALRDSEERFRSIIEATNEWIWSIDINGRHTYSNPAVQNILGYRPEELVGRNSLDFLHDEDRRRIEELLPTLIREKRGWSGLVLRWRHRDGSFRYLESNSVPIFDAEGAVVGYRGSDRDITDRMQNERALTELADREALINRISKAVHKSLGLTEIFQTAVHELGSHLGVDRCLLFMLDEQAGLARTVAEYRAAGIRSASRDYSLSLLGDLIAGIREHAVLAFDDVSADERVRDVYNSILRQIGVRSVMYVTIRVGDETTGCFALSTTRNVHSWSETDIALARAVADQTGIAIRQAELYQKAEATSARQSLINRLSLAIRASLSLPEVLNTATHELGRALSASRVHLHLYDPANPVSQLEHEYVAPHAPSIRHIDASYDDPVGQRLLRTQEPLVVDDALNYTAGTPQFSAYVRQQAAHAGLRSQIAYPLIVNERFRGALCIHQTDRVRHWTEEELALVEAVAAQLATGIAQAELFELTKRAKKEWETTFDAMSDGIFIFDQTGRLIRVNRAGAAMEDTWPHLLLGRQCCDILRTHGDEDCIVEKCLKDGRSVTTEVVPERFNRPLLVTVEPITEAGRGNVGAVCTARDLSELRKAEAMAREHQSLLTNILESVREPICAIDPAGYFMWLNSATYNAGSYRPEDLIGHHFLELIYPADREIARAYFESALKGETQSYEVRYHTREGEVRYALFDNAPLVVDERITGVLGIMRDITEQKQQRARAAQADKLRALGQLASGVAHDFNNALAAVLGRAQLMRRQIKDEALTRNLEIIQTAAEDAAATVRRIQTFARQSQGTEFEMLDAGKLLRDAVEITRTRWENEARMRGLHYEVELNAEPESFVKGNASELREVFVNLIVNAVDAMPFGGRLSITCERADSHWRLRFTDTGTGMTEDVREKIFEPFYTTKGAQGTGLGLSVSYGIIERHGGLISVESEVGRGTTFTIDLPAARTAAARSDKPQEQTDTPSLSILVVDDELVVRETLSEMLVVMEHSVASVGSGPEALERLKGGDHFDLVFTDLSMPGMDGWEVAREIRHRWPDVAIALVTGYGKGTEPPSGEKNLIDGVIGKPFDFEEVREVISQVSSKIMASDR